MSDLCQIAQDRHRIGAIGILPRKLGQRRGGFALQDHVEKIKHSASVGKAKHGADLIGGCLARAVADRLIEKRGRVTGRAFGAAGDEREGIVGDLGSLGAGDLAQEGDHHLRLDPPQIEPLTAREDRDRNLADLGRGEDELHMGGRLFERFEKRVERAC